MAKQNKMDGIIAITYSDIDKHVSEDIPFISIDRYFSKDITYISSDNYEGGRIAAEKLIESGCSKLAYIGRGSKINNATRKRKEGFIEYCIEKNIPYKVCEVLAPIDEYENLLDKFIDENLKGEDKVDGVFAVTDDQALQFIQKVKKIGIDVPKDVQVVGFDGRRSSKNDIIKISTIRQPIELLAEGAVKELLNIIEKKEVRKKVILPVRYIKGYTTYK